MKFMMNGALTIGTRDGATIEMAAGGGRGELFPVRPDGRASRQYARLVQSALALRKRTGNAAGSRFDCRQSLQPRRAGHLLPDCGHAPGPRRSLPAPGGLEVVPGGRPERLVGLYGEPKAWASKAILNVASSGKFSSDRTIAAVRERNLESATVPGVMNNPEHQVALPPFDRAPYVRGVDACHLAAFTLRHRGRGAGGFCVGGPAPRCRPVVVAGSAFGANWMWQLAVLSAVIFCGQCTARQPGPFD